MLTDCYQLGVCIPLHTPSTMMIISAKSRLCHFPDRYHVFQHFQKMPQRHASNAIIIVVPVPFADHSNMSNQLAAPITIPSTNLSKPAW